MPLKKQCRLKLIVPDDTLDFDKESMASEEVPERNPRVKPPPERYKFGYTLSVFFNILLLIACMPFMI